MSTSMGPESGGGERRIDRDDVQATDSVRITGGQDAYASGREDLGVTQRREVIRPSADDDVLVRSQDTRRAGPCLNRIVAGVLGATYLLVGIAGFFLHHRRGVHFAGHDGTLLFNLFEVNNLHSVVHLVIGAVLLLSALAGHSAARSANLLVALVYLVIGIGGIFAHDTKLDQFALNPADHILHLGTAALLGLTALVDRGHHGDVVTSRRARTV